MEEFLEFSKTMCSAMQQQQIHWEEQNKLIQKQIELLQVQQFQYQQQQQIQLQEWQEQQLDLQKQILKQQEVLEKILTKQVDQKEGSRFFSAEGITNSLSEFHYKPMESVTFPAYFRRYEKFFQKDVSYGLTKKKLYYYYKN